jgi:hypothetical protein
VQWSPLAPQAVPLTAAINYSGGRLDELCHDQNVPTSPRPRAGSTGGTGRSSPADQRSLLLAAQPTISPAALLPADAPTDPIARLDVFMSAFTDYKLHVGVPAARLAAAVLEPAVDQPVLRQGRAIGWIGKR